MSAMPARSRRTISAQRRVFAIALACLVLAGTGGPAAGTGAAADDAVEQAGDIRHVANIPYANGTDLEFATKTVVRLDPEGNPICTRDPATGGCLRDEEGQVIYETEERDYVFAGADGLPVKVIDVTDPEQPELVSQVLCSLSQNDVQVSGDLLVMANLADAGRCTMPDGSKRGVRGFAVADVSDPRFPEVLSAVVMPDVPLPGGGTYFPAGHNVTAHPTEPLVYVSTQDPTPSMIPIWDLSDPADPELVRYWEYPGALAPHDITFNAEGTRAYVASVNHTDILDATDPRNPELLTTIVDPSIQIHHQADPTPDGRYLLVSDEAGGALWPACPGGGIHIYDLTVEAAPVKVGAFFADETGTTPGSCTAHVFRINPDGATMAIGWYEAGVYVVDFSRVGIAAAGSGSTLPLGAVTIGSMSMPQANTWAAKMWQERHPGYVFANDRNRGLDVFFVESLSGPQGGAA